LPYKSIACGVFFWFILNGVCEATVFPDRNILNMWISNQWYLRWYWLYGFFS